MNLTCLIALSWLYNTSVSKVQFVAKDQCEIGSDLFHFDLKDNLRELDLPKPSLESAYMNHFYENKFPGIEDRLYNPTAGLQLKIVF